MNNELITEIANFALTLSLIVAVIFGIAQVRIARRDRKERLTLEALRNFQTHEFAGMIFFISTTKMASTYEEWKKLEGNDRVLLIQFAQQMESIGMLVAEKYINLDLIDKTLGSFVATAWQKYKPLFSDMRVKNADPFLGEYFQWLAEQIDRRMEQSPRKPFYESGVTIY